MAIRYNVVKFYIFTLLVYFYSWMPIWLLYYEKKGMSLGQIGLLDAVGFVVMALVDVPTGALADNFGRKYLLAAGAFLYALGMLGITTRLFSVWFFLGFALWNISDPMFNGANTALLYESLDETHEAESFQKILGRANIVMQASQLVASLLGAWLAYQLGMRDCFYVAALGAFGATIVAMSMVEPQRRQKDPSAGMSIRNVITRAFAVVRTNPRFGYLAVFSSLLTAVVFLLTFVIYQPYTVTLGYSIAALGPILVSIKLGSIAGNAITSWAREHVAPRLQIAALPVLFATGFVIMAAVHSKYSVVAIIAMAFIMGVANPTISAEINSLIGSGERATLLSGVGFLTTAFIAIGELLVLLAAGHMGISLAVGLVGFATLVLLLPLALLAEKSATPTMN